MMRPKLFSLMSPLLAATMVLAACTPAATTTPTSATQAPDATSAPEATAPPQSTVNLPDINPADYSGTIIAAGSSTVFPLTERMAEIFEADGFAGEITIDSIGSGAGLERFCVSGETDIANASRAIEADEIEACNAIGREPVEFRVGTDALAVTVSQENDFLEDITIEELAAAFSTDTALWSDVNPAWPAEPIRRFSPGTDSGTYDYFLEAVMEEVFGDEGETKLLDAAGTQFSEDDNVLVQGVIGSPYAIGYFGYAYYQENASSLKVLNVNGVEPVNESVDNGDYPLARPLFIYSDAAIMQKKPQVAAFINYYLTYVNDEVVDVGYFPANREALNAARQAWLDANGGAAQ